MRIIIHSNSNIKETDFDIGEEKTKELQNLVDNYKIKLNLTLWEDENTLWLNHIIIPKKHRHKGLGTKVLSILCNVLDTKNWNCKLLVANCFGMSEDVLIKFYSTFNFVKYDEDKYGTYMIRRKDIK